ncbi:exopolysaccharide biosynthesis polyprenyl glycosylphosphotransferase [Acetobacter orientalis]|uniref:exopolysaccharide biosynthesis polyprenyl glycosylphosphotransferase n=1 Tax=Acetobacter orientalis TaxID=146474 RepID=UPI00248D4693|nr:exopolysaccharide biosynthesis polyprenyl glycosylphosphotransferase [Acetobacter orientalis]
MTNDLLPTQDLPKRLSRRNIKIDAGLLPHNMNDPNLLQQEELRLSNLHEHRFFQEKQRVIIIGGFPDGEKIAEKLALEPDLYDVIGIFDDRINRLQNIHHAVPILGNINDMIAFCRHELPDMIIIAIFDASRERLRTIIRKTIVLPANIYLAMDVKSIIKNYTQILSEEETDITLLSLSKIPPHGIKYFQKYLEDKILSLFFITILSPIMIFISIIIKLDSRGPIFFKQDRYGFNNKTIKILKFRTMYIDKEDVSGAQRTIQNDPRVTRVGRYLRNWSLDELPQFFNVLGGSMSIVGPRAHAVAMRVNNEMYEKIIDCYSARHKVKPGITGLSQVMGYRGEVSNKKLAQKRIDYDLFYINNWSLYLDLKIILKSIYVCLFRRNDTF